MCLALTLPNRLFYLCLFACLCLTASVIRNTVPPIHHPLLNFFHFRIVSQFPYRKHYYQLQSLCTVFFFLLFQVFCCCCLFFPILKLLAFFLPISFSEVLLYIYIIGQLIFLDPLISNLLCMLSLSLLLSVCVCV